LRLSHCRGVIVKTRQHVLPVEFGDHLAFLSERSGFDGLLQDETEVAATTTTAGTSTAATTARISSRESG
jgi:hypothetical protein